MIPTPQLGHMVFDTPIMGALGYICATLSNGNRRITALALSVYSVANTAIFKLTKAWICPRLNLSPQAAYIATNLATSTATVFAARYLELISRRWTALFLAASYFTLIARLRILSES